MANQTINTILEFWLSGVKTDLIKNYNRLGLRASGEWEQSLESFNEPNASGFEIGIKGRNYTEYLEKGRRPNKASDPESVKNWVGWAGSTFIAKWVKDKGLENKLNPYAVANKIATEGWKVTNPNNAGGLVSDVVTNEKLSELNRGLSLFYIDSIKTELLDNLRVK